MAVPTAPIPPIILSGPATATFVNGGNTLVIYFEDGLVIQEVTKTWTPKSSYGTSLGPRLQSRKFTITGKPYGAFASATALGYYFPFTPSLIGQSVLTGTLAVQQINSNSSDTVSNYAFARAGITKQSKITLSTRTTILGEIEFTALVPVGTAIATADSMFTPTVAAFADTSYTGNAPSPFAVVTWGTSPFAAFGSSKNIEIDYSISVDEWDDIGVGIGDIILTDMALKCTMAPNSLTKANIETASLTQGSGALLPGQPIGGAGTSLVIKTPVIYVTMPSMGVTDFKYNFAKAKPLIDNITFEWASTYTSGVQNGLLSFATPS